MLITLAWIAGGMLIESANRKIGAPPDDFPAIPVQIDSESGAKICGWHREIADANSTVVLLHPIRGNRLSMLSRSKVLSDHGYSTPVSYTHLTLPTKA